MFVLLLLLLLLLLLQGRSRCTTHYVQWRRSVAKIGGQGQLSQAVKLFQTPRKISFTFHFLTHVFDASWSETCTAIEQQFWMKKCDILGGKTYCDPPTYFREFKTPNPWSTPLTTTYAHTVLLRQMLTCDLFAVTNLLVCNSCYFHGFSVSPCDAVPPRFLPSICGGTTQFGDTLQNLSRRFATVFVPLTSNLCWRLW